MNWKLNAYLNSVFAPHDGVKSVIELKADLLFDVQERFRELKAEGKDDETASQETGTLPIAIARGDSWAATDDELPPLHESWEDRCAVISS